MGVNDDLQYTEADLMQYTETDEGLRLAAYQDSGGVWTIGYGHTGSDVHKGLVWTKQEAVAALRKDMGLPDA